jgi:O-antigen/teichoic acid export membrane protein
MSASIPPIPFSRSPAAAVPISPTMAVTPKADTGASSPGRLWRAIITLISGEVFGRAAAFAATALLARRLGPDNFGILGFATALSGYFALAVSSGLHDVGTREVARRPHHAAEIYTTVVVIRLVLAAAATLVLIAVAQVLPKPDLVRWVVALCALSFFSLALDPVWVLRGLERPGAAAAGVVLSQCLYAAGVVWLIREPADVARVPLVQFGGELLSAIIFGAVVIAGSRPRFALHHGLEILRSGSYIALGRVFRTVIISFDVVWLGLYASDREVGLYAAAYRVTFLLMSIAAAISAAYLPSYSRVLGTDLNQARLLVSKSLETSSLVGAPLVVGGLITAPALLELLFGAEYRDGAPAFRVLVVSVGLIFSYWIAGNVLLAENRTGMYAAIHGAAALLNIVMNALLIPAYGITGAATATLCSELAVALASGIILQRRHLLPSLSVVTRAVAAASAMALVLICLSTWHVLGQIAVGGVVYLAVLASLGAWPRGGMRSRLTVTEKV